MGISGIGVTELLVVLAIVLLVFGSKKLGSLGKDLGGAIRDFRTAMKEGPAALPEPGAAPRVQDEAGQTAGAASPLKSAEAAQPMAGRDQQR